MKKIFKKRKGFTLIELLAVIVILAVIMLVATTSVQGVMLDARKGSFRNEFLSLLESANIRASLDQMNGANGMNKANTQTCYPINLITQFSKKDADNYTGSVLVSKEDGKTKFKAWMSNGEFVISAQDGSVTNAQVEASNTPASTNCGGASGANFQFATDES